MTYYEFMPRLLNMTLTASIVICVVIVLRLFLKKAPRAISYALWFIVLFRLLCPISFESSFSAFSLMNVPTASQGDNSSVMEYIPENIVHTEYPAVTLPIPALSETINETLPQGEEQTVADPLEAPLYIATFTWIFGVAAMLVYSLCSYLKLRRKLQIVVPLRENIFTADDIGSPFVVGLLRPKIYLPCNLNEKEQEYIILHEQFHIKRFDHIFKAIAFLALTVHWFNPLVWLAFILASKDMEMSCDEAVIGKMGSDIRADYSASLLALSTGRRIIAGTPLAFGEGDAADRIKNLSKWKKPAFWIIAVAVVACIAVAVCFGTNPASRLDSMTYIHQETAIGQRADFDVNLGKNVTKAELVAEMWQNGQCISSSPVIVTSQTKKLTLLFSDRREGLNLIGENIQIDTDGDAGSLVTYFGFPEHIVGWAFTSWQDTVNVPVKAGEDVILAAMACDMGSGVRSIDCQSLTSEPERLSSADCMIVIRAKFYEPDAPDTTEDTDSVDVLTEAPELTVKTADQTITAMQGTTSWMYHVEGDTWSGLETDSMHPLDNNSREIIPVLRYNALSTISHMKPNDAILLFDYVPDSVSVRCWDEKYWGNPEGNDNKAELLPYEGPNFCIELKDRGYIYEVIAEWNSNSEYNGTARYSFYAAPNGIEENDRTDNYAGPDIPSDTANPITVRSSGKTIHPFLSFAYSETWTENGFLCVDGGLALNELTEWSEATYLPALVYSEDFTISYADKVSFRYVIPFDESKNQMDHLYDITELENLDPGRYFIGIVVNQEGDYIEQAKQSECTGWTCLFRLTVE